MKTAHDPHQIELIRARLGVTQVHFAKLMGIAPQNYRATVNRTRKGVSGPRKRLIALGIR